MARDQIIPSNPLSDRKVVRGRYQKVNRKQGSPRKGQRYKSVTLKGGDIVHRYADGTEVGRGVGQGQRQPAAKPRPRPQATRRPSSDQLLTRDLRAAEKLKFGPAQRQLNQERLVSDQRMANVGSWYDQYKRDIASAAQRSAQATAMVQHDAYSAAHQAASADQQALAGQKTSAQADAAKRGVDVDQSAYNAAQAAISARQAQGVSLGNLAGYQGQNQAAHMNELSAIASGQGVQARADEGARRREIEQSGRDLASQRGAFRVTYKQDRAEAARKAALENAAFGLDVTKERNDQRNTRRDDRRQGADSRSLRRDRLADNARADRTERRLQQAEDWDQAHPNAHGGKGAGGSFTSTQLRSGRTQLRSIIANGPKTKIVTDQKGKKHTVNLTDPLMADVAYYRAKGLPVPWKLAQKFKRAYGFLPQTKRPSQSAVPRNADGSPG